MVDLLSLALGALIGAVVTFVVMLYVLYWAICRSYELGWHDRDAGKWIGDKTESTFLLNLFLSLPLPLN